MKTSDVQPFTVLSLIAPSGRAEILTVPTRAVAPAVIRFANRYGISAAMVRTQAMPALCLAA